MLALGATTAVFGQISVLKKVDDKYNSATHLKVIQSIQIFEDARDARPVLEERSVIIKTPGLFYAKGPKTAVLIADDIGVKVNELSKTIVIDSLDQQRKAEVIDSRLALFVEEADTTVLDTLPAGNIMARTAFLKEDKMAFEFEIDPNKMAIVSMKETKISPSHDEERGKVYPMKLTKTESVEFEPAELESIKKLADFIQYDAQNQLVPNDFFRGYTLINPLNMKPQI